MLVDVPMVTFRKMMGEYLLYSENMLFGGIYDDRFLIKPTPSACAVCPREEFPYEGVSPMRLVELTDPAAIAELVSDVCFELVSNTSRR